MNFSLQIGIALALSLVGASLLTLVGNPALAVAVVSVLYGLYVMWHSEQRVGRIVVGTSFIAVTCAGAAWLSLSHFVIAQAAAIWLVRCLYVHGRPLACLADLALAIVGVGAAVWAASTGSAFLALWSFFLVQAFFVWIPGAPSQAAADTDRAFADAKRTADDALQRLLMIR